MGDNTESVEIKCDICEKTFSAKKNLTRHVKEKHSENVAEDKCQFCDQAFNSKRELQHHQKRKREGKLVGCGVENASDLSTIGSKFGSTIGSESSPSLNVSLVSSLNSDLLNTEDTIEDDESMDGWNDAHRIDDLQEFDGFARDAKRVLNSHVGHEERDSAGFVTKVYSDGFLYGACKRVRDMVKNHVKYTCEGVEDLDKILRMRDTLCDMIVVSRDQHDAIHMHKDTARECSKECTFVKRKARLHKQQVLLGLSILETGQVTLEKWKTFVRGHLREIKMNDVNPTSFIKVLRDRFTGGMAKIVLELGSDIMDGSLSDHPPPQSSSTVPKNPVNIQQATLQVSAKRFEKGQKRLDRKTLRRKRQRTEETDDVGYSVPAGVSETGEGSDSVPVGVSETGEGSDSVPVGVSEMGEGSDKPPPQPSSSGYVMDASREKVNNLERRMTRRQVGPK